MHTTTVKGPPLSVVAVLLVIVVIWGAAFSGIKVLLEQLSPNALTVGRLFISAATLSLMLPFAPRGKVVRHKGDGWRLILIGLTGAAGYHLAINWGEHFVSAGVASLVIASMPVMVAVAAVVFLRERLGPRKLTGVLISFIGVFGLLVFSNGDFEAGHALGVLITLGAPVSWAIYTLISKPLSARYDGVRINLLGAWIGAVLVVPLGVGDFGQIFALDALGWFWLIYLGALSSAFAYVGYAWALSHWTASGVSSFVYLVPVSSLIWAFFLLGERPAVAALAAGALVIGGVVLVQTAKVREAT